MGTEPGGSECPGLDAEAVGPHNLWGGSTRVSRGTPRPPPLGASPRSEQGPHAPVGLCAFVSKSFFFFSFFFNGA